MSFELFYLKLCTEIDDSLITISWASYTYSLYVSNLELSHYDMRDKFDKCDCYDSRVVYCGTSSSQISIL